MPPVPTHKPPRTYRIVGPQQRIDERETPHPRAERGEFGERIRSMRKPREQGPLKRLLADGDFKGDPNNSLQHLFLQVPEGAVHQNQLPVTDPVAMAKKIKEMARFFGADVVGITHLDQAYVYSHRARGLVTAGEKPGDPIHLPHKYAICLGFTADFDRFLACNSDISGSEYALGHKKSFTPMFLLAAYIRGMGYPARAHYHSRYEINPIPLAINAGLGELGRHGMLIHEEFGSRLHLYCVTTDLPLAVDEPVDIGVEDVCKLCMKCAQTCPTYSIPFGGKVVINGVEKWAINVETCYKGKLSMHHQWNNCLICVTSCCYNKRSAWWHTLAGWMLKKIPIPLRPFYIVPLLWMDDLIWGKRPWRRMQWIGFDNAPVPATCSVPGCLAKHKPPEWKPFHKVPKPGLRTIEKGGN